jgi:hypothetical protein
MKTRTINILLALVVVFLFVPAASATSSDAVPASVDVAFFRASSEGHFVRLTWETFSEENAQGFNVYRADALNGPRVRLNASMVAARFPGSHMGAAYELLDSTASPRVTYYYWLEAVDSSFGSVEYGPVSGQVTFSIQPGTARWTPKANMVHRLTVRP